MSITREEKLHKIFHLLEKATHPTIDEKTIPTTEIDKEIYALLCLCDITDFKPQLSDSTKPVHDALITFSLVINLQKLEAWLKKLSELNTQSDFINTREFKSNCEALIERLKEAKKKLEKVKRAEDDVLKEAIRQHEHTGFSAQEKEKIYDHVIKITMIINEGKNSKLAPEYLAKLNDAYNQLYMQTYFFTVKPAFETVRPAILNLTQRLTELEKSLDTLTTIHETYLSTHVQHSDFYLILNDISEIQEELTTNEETPLTLEALQSLECSARDNLLGTISSNLAGYSIKLQEEMKAYEKRYHELKKKFDVSCARLEKDLEKKQDPTPKQYLDFLGKRLSTCRIEGIQSSSSVSTSNSMNGKV